MPAPGESRVLVLGAGPAGLAAADELARQGVGVLVVERDSAPGGLARRLACKATDECARCGVCLVFDLLAAVEENQLIQLSLDSRLQSLAPAAGGLAAAVEAGRGVHQETVAGVVVAVGAEPGGGAALSLYGHKVWPNVITGLELEEMIRKQEWVERPSDGRPPGRLAFIQCVGSRDVKRGRAYCSRICCGYALRLARWLRRHQPDVAVSIFYMDLQTAGRDQEAWLSELKGEVEFIRALPGAVRSGPDDALILTFKPEGRLDLETRAVDLMVLSVGLAPRIGVDLWGLSPDEDGFLRPVGEGPIIVAGAAAGPMGVAEAIQQGRLAGLKAAAWVGGAGA